MRNQRRPFKLTKAGWVFILYTIGVGAGAINTGNNLLYLVFGLFLGLLLASGVLSDLSLWRVEFKPLFPEYAVINQATALPFCLINKKKHFSSFSVMLEVEGSVNGRSLEAKTHVPLILPMETHSQYLTVSFPSRGVFSISRLRLATHYPFGLLKKWWRISQSETSQYSLYVLPSLLPLDLDFMDKHFRSLNEEAAVAHKGDGSSVFHLRDYQYSDHVRYVDWKASAKRDRGVVDQPSWIVREMEKDDAPRRMIVLPAPHEVVAFSDRECEILVQVAYSIWMTGQSRGQQILLVHVNDAGQKFLISEGKRFFALWNPRLFTKAFSDGPETEFGTGRMVSVMEIYHHFS